MFNLEQALTEWRRQMMQAGVRNPAVLEELENHLRENFAALVSIGTPEAQAFQLAARRVGSPSLVGAEFEKIGRGPILPVKIGVVVLVSASVLTAAFVAQKLFAGKMNLLTYAHILSVTIGYLAIFLIGSFGICGIFYRSARSLSPQRSQSLGRAVQGLNHAALGLVIVGLITGMFLSRQLFGRYWQWDPREIGALAVIAWLMALAAVQRFRPIGSRAFIVPAIAGNIVVSLAWFGAGMLAHHRNGYWWPLALFVGIQIPFLLLGFVGREEDRTAPGRF